MSEIPEISAEKMEFEELKKKLVAYVRSRAGKKKQARGFSKGELEAINLSVEQALKIGIPVDLRRDTVYEENIETLKSIDLKRLAELASKFIIRKRKVKGKHRKRVFRGLTSAGKKMRGLKKDALRHTHKHKWKHGKGK
ncbi:MAG TPA: ribosomal protein L13e [Geobacterales bacterium]|nr:ribosomal protein L13e [Geobacterales bacterium]